MRTQSHRYAALAGQLGVLLFGAGILRALFGGGGLAEIPGIALVFVLGLVGAFLYATYGE